MTDTWTNERQQTCWHVEGALSPCCDAAIATNGADLWCCACHKPLVVKVLCEVYSRIVGYLRPVQNWNEAKKVEFEQRQTYDLQMAVDRAKTMIKGVK